MVGKIFEKWVLATKAKYHPRGDETEAPRVNLVSQLESGGGGF